MIVNNIVNFNDLKTRYELKNNKGNGCAAKNPNKRICRIIYKDITINFWHNNHAYSCNVERGN
ncbi:MAG: hypothetical protein ISQ32_04305 [Rickettsiales bacterium]|nr:hypothetical protein [Rickettsiales bacterium]